MAILQGWQVVSEPATQVVGLWDFVGNDGVIL
jgi:hypothetical protein